MWDANESDDEPAAGLLGLRAEMAAVTKKVSQLSLEGAAAAAEAAPAPRARKAEFSVAPATAKQRRLRVDRGDDVAWSFSERAEHRCDAACPPARLGAASGPLFLKKTHPTVTSVGGF